MIFTHQEAYHLKNITRNHVSIVFIVIIICSERSMNKSERDKSQFIADH